MSGKCSREDLEAAFALFDKDNSKKISVAEFELAMKNVDPTLSKQDIQAMVKGADKSGDGELSLEEFIKVMNSDQDDKELKAAFDAFDADGSGFITKQELRQAMTNCGSNVSEKELNEMIASADANSDGKVSFEEFKKMMGAN